MPKVKTRNAYKGMGILLLAFCITGTAVFAMNQHVRFCESEAIASVRKINAAQATYVERSPNRTYASNFDQLVDMGLLPERLRDGEDRGYRFSIQLSPEYPEYDFKVSALPLLRWYSIRSFFTDQSGVIRFRVEYPWSNPEAPLEIREVGIGVR